MHRISKRIVRDEADRPIAVQIDYDDWLEIERILAQGQRPRRSVDLSKYHGVLRLTEDPLEFQRRIRAEWDR